MKNMENKDTCIGFAYTTADFFHLRLQKVLVDFLVNRLHHILSSDLLKRCSNMSC